MSTNKFLQVLLPQPGEDLKSWARFLTTQLQLVLQQVINDTQTIANSPSLAPLYQSDGVTPVVTSTGEYKLADGTVVVDALGLHVFDAVGFEVINGPVIRIDTAHLVDSAVVTAKLAAGAVTNTVVADNAISTPKLQANSVVAGKIAANSIVANDGVIANAAIADAQIATLNASKINAGDIAAARMSANIVTALEGKFATLSALAASLGIVQIQAGGALFTQGVTGYTTGTGFWVGEHSSAYKMRIGNPAGARLDWDGNSLKVFDSSNSLILSVGSVTSGLPGTYIANASITTAHIVNANITTAKIADANITTAKIANAAITSALIADASITNAKIGTAQIDTLQIAGQAITVPVSAFTDGSFLLNSGSDVTAQSATLNSSGSVKIINFSFKISLGSFSAEIITWKLKDPSGTTLVSDSFTINANEENLISFSYQATPDGTYTVTVATNIGAVGNCLVSKRFLGLLGAKR